MIRLARCFGLALIALLSLPAAAQDTATRITKPGDYSFAIEHGGLTRMYRVHVPASYDDAKPVPLLFALHGGGGSMDYQADDTKYGLITKSEQAGFVAVFPNGANLTRQMNIDHQRIYATGMSNGGLMSYRLACEMSDVFKAIAPVAGTDNTRSCAPKQPVAVLHIHAKNDTHVL